MADGTSIERDFPAEPASIPVIRQVVVEFARRAGASPERCADVALAISEAATNAVVHAYVEASRPGSVHVTAGVNGAELEVTIADHGRGLLPRPDSPGLGLGMPLINDLASRLEIADGDHGGTELRMRFALGPRPG